MHKATIVCEFNMYSQEAEKLLLFCYISIGLSTNSAVFLCHTLMAHSNKANLCWLFGMWHSALLCQRNWGILFGSKLTIGRYDILTNEPSNLEGWLLYIETANLQ